MSVSLLQVLTRLNTQAGIDVVDEIQVSLNRMAGTTGLDSQDAANHFAGTVGLELIAALNEAAETWGLELNQVCNIIAGTTGLEAQDALSEWEEDTSGSFVNEFGTGY
jgi:hypothetical protein